MGKVIKMFFQLNDYVFENVMFYLIVVCVVVFIFFFKYYMKEEINECQENILML